MALAETLDVDKLLELYEDDWHNLYRPLSYNDTNLVGSSSGSTILDSKINDIFSRQSQIEEIIGDLEDLPEDMRNVTSEFTDIKRSVQQIKMTQNEIKNFINDILDFENQSGQTIGK